MKIEDNILKFQEYLANERRYPETTINSYDNDLSNKYVTFLKKHPEIEVRHFDSEIVPITDRFHGMTKEETKGYFKGADHEHKRYIRLEEIRNSSVDSLWIESRIVERVKQNELS